MKARIRIQEVAAAAGVSIGTASDGINGKGRMSEATRRRIRETATTLGYRPHHAARSLRQGRSGLIGMILRAYSPGMHGGLSYFAELISLSTVDALAHGYALVVIPSEQALDGAAWLPLDAAIVADPVDDDPVLPALRARGIPMVTDWSLAQDPDVICVDHDHAATMHAVLDHFAEQGARSMGLLTGGASDHYTRVSVAAFHAWCAERRLPGAVEWAKEAPVDSALRLLDHRDRPDAIFSLWAVAGHAMLEAARRRSLQVPADLLLACADDMAYTTTNPPLTTVSFQPRLMSEAGGPLLGAALAGDFPEQPNRLVPTMLTIRASSSRTPGPERSVVIQPRIPEAHR
ncbi:LacI family DNA-binding transcriptional regulator [Nonomuraea sp. NPDC050153]|uniref:LacI family DNA-binding transcriptional regulator n=1 Tax=Nonomuraea sp. NPDC050153 TaxID=3364359 RepID=UPI0037991C10